jgi:hypothetical protein
MASRDESPAPEEVLQEGTFCTLRLIKKLDGTEINRYPVDGEKTTFGRSVKTVRMDGDGLMVLRRVRRREEADNLPSFASSCFETGDGCSRDETNDVSSFVCFCLLWR